MNTESPVDFQAALDAFRREEHKPENPFLSPGNAFFTPAAGAYVDYLAVVKAWDKQQAGKYVIYTEEHENEGNL